jgi:hypothetical protein
MKTSCSNPTSQATGRWFESAWVCTMSAASENGRAPGGGPAAALPYGAFASYRSHLDPHVGFSKQRLTSSPMLASVHELQRDSKSLRTCGQSYARYQSARERASDHQVCHNEQSPDPRRPRRGESVKASSSIRYQITNTCRNPAHQHSGLTHCWLQTPRGCARPGRVTAIDRLPERMALSGRAQARQ